jgi:hypothetical protein
MMTHIRARIAELEALIGAERQRSQALADFSMYLCSRIESIEEWAETVSLKSNNNKIQA